MNEEHQADKKETVKYFYEHIVSAQRIEEVPGYVSEACCVRSGDKTIPVGIAGMQRHIRDVKSTYPDLKMTITRQYCDGDCVVSEFVMQGTHQGEWLGMKPSGKKLRITGVNIDTVINGKIVEHGGAANTFEALFEARLIQPST